MRMLRLQTIPLLLRVAVLLAAILLPCAAIAPFLFGSPADFMQHREIIGIVFGVCTPLAVLALVSIVLSAKDSDAKLAGLGKMMSIVEYKPDGTIITANPNFLTLFGNTLSAIVGRHHSIFVTKEYAETAEYRGFWSKLAGGEAVAQKFKRKRADGNPFWIQTNYVPVLNLSGKPYKVVNFMSDITVMEKEREEQMEEQVRVVEALAAGLKLLSEGKLTARIEDKFSGQYDKLKNDFNSALARLQETMKSVLSTSGTIGTGAAEICQAADDLSRRTEQQAASLEETAAALEEITATVKKTAQNAKSASSGMLTAKATAEEGGQVVETAIKAMSEIEQSSKKITDIIGVIDEIAFQTNLLALNAGVEAARAGEAGRGFAVVASEVRALAQRAGDAAKEIRTLIKASTEHVDAGVKSVGESGQALRRIVGQVVEVNSLVTEMAQATQQQSTGIDEVNTAVGQMDQVTQQNAAMVEQSTAASRNLASETQSLTTLVGFFSVGAETQDGARRTNTKPRLVSGGNRSTG